MIDLIKQHLHCAKQRMKRQADENRSEREFQLDDWVFLKLQPYVQSSLADRSNQKLAFKYFGPFHIIERIGSVAYKLELPASSSIHPVFMFPSSRRPWVLTILSRSYCHHHLFAGVFRRKSFSIVQSLKDQHLCDKV